MIAGDAASHVQAYHVSFVQGSFTAAQYGRGGFKANPAARGIHADRAQGALAECELPQQAFRAEHPEAHQSLVALAHHEGEEFAPKLCLAHSDRKSTRLNSS